MVSSTPRSIRAALIALLSLGLGACQTTVHQREYVPPPPELAQAEANLMKPFAGQKVVIADQLYIDVSPNFYNKMTWPAGGRRTKAEESDNIVWDVRAPVSKRLQPMSESERAQLARQGYVAGQDPSKDQAGGLGRGRLDLLIGDTTFVVTGQIRMRLLRRASPTLNISAKGDVRLLTQGAQKEDSFHELRFEAGRIRGRRAAPADRAAPPSGNRPQR